MLLHLVRATIWVLLFISFLPQAFAQGCPLTWVNDPPFYLSRVTQNRIEKFDTPKQLTVESRDPAAAESEISSEFFRKQPTEFKNNSEMLGKGSRVQLVNQSDVAAFATHTADTMLRVKVLSVEDRYSRYQPGSKAALGEQGFIAKNSLDPTIEGKTFVLKRNAILLKMDGLAPMELSAGMYLRPEVQDGKYRVRKCADGISYVFNAIIPFGQNHAYSATEVLLPTDNACLDLHAYTMPQFQELLKLQDFTNTLYKRTLGLDHFDVNDWGMVRVPFNDPPPEISAANHDITGISPDGTFLHYQGQDLKGSDIWGQPKTVCALMKVMKDWSKKCDASADSRCTPETGDISFITPAKVVPKNKSQDGLDPLGHKSHFSGYCIDVRPFKKSTGTGSINIGGGHSADYDNQRTKDFIEFLEHEGASPIYFNDRSIYMDPTLGDGTTECRDADLENETHVKVRPCPGHSNHIHFCLLPNNFQNLGC